MSETQYDYIIAGSGTSGAIAACRLQESGAKCLLLEAGRRFRTEEFPMPEGDYTPQMFWGGGAEFNTQCDLAFLRGRGVGGGSLVNDALMDRFDAVALDDWRAESGVSFFSEAGMDPHYHFAETNIVLQTIPLEHRNKNAQIFCQALENRGHQWKQLRRCQSDCATGEGNDCITCLGGCHRKSKQTMMDTYIPRAEAAGLKVEEHVLLHRLDYAKDGVTLHGERAGVPVSFKAPKVILATGAFGSTQLLLRSGFQKRFPSLGTKISMHPQFLSFAVFDEPVDSHKGAMQSVASNDPVFRKAGYKLENVFAPPIALAVLYQRIGPELLRFMRKYRHLACLEVAVRDEHTGVLKVNGKGRLQIHKNLTAQDKNRAKAGHDLVQEMFSSMNPREIIQCPWGFGLHLMGGCAIGTDGAKSVVDPEFRIHDHPNLYIADGGVFPNAPGINPALTIMALTHRMTEGILANGRTA